VKNALSTLAIVATLAATTLPPSSTAAADMLITDRSVHATRPTKLDITGGVGFFGAFLLGAAGWYSMPLMNDGFIPSLNDAFVLEVGARLHNAWVSAGICDYSYVELAALGGVRWDFYLTPDWTVFAKAKAGFGYDFASIDCGAGINDPDVGGAIFAGDYGVGAYWNFATDMALRLEFGYPYINVGISLPM
jgi:hypothetical protein